MGKSSGPPGQKMEASHTVLWQDGLLIDLSGQCADSFPAGINERGVIVGSCFMEGTYHPVHWENGVMSPLPEPESAVVGYTDDINDRGQVLGNIGIGDEPWRHIVLWTRSK